MTSGEVGLHRRAPCNYLDAGRIVGCDVDLARRAVEGLGEAFEPLHTTFGELLPGLTQGLWEVTPECS